MGAAGYKKSELRGQTDTPLNQVRGGLGGGSVAHLQSSHLGNSAFTGEWVQVGGRPKVLLALPFSSPGTFPLTERRSH